MASVQGKTSIKIDQLINDTVVGGSVSSAGDLILTTRGGAGINAGSVRKPFGVTWNKATAYVTGDVVGYMGALWKAKADNSGKSPALYTSLWTPLTGLNLSGWSEKDPYFAGDQASESWQFFWKTGAPTTSLTKVAGEFETGVQALKIDMPASTMQRIYMKEENVVDGGVYVTVTVRAKLLSSATTTINAELVQNDVSGKPEPFETGVITVASAEGAKSLTTSWQTFTFTCLAANAKPRATMNVYVSNSTSAATVVIDRVRTYRGKGPALTKVEADTLYLPKYQEYDSGWIYLNNVGGPSLQNGATVYGGDFGMLRFRRIGDVVFMEGLVGNPPAAGNVIFVLPDGFRPDGDIIPITQGNGATENHGIKVYANGNVVTGPGVTGWASLSCQFPVAGAATPWHVIGAAGEIAFGAGWTNYGSNWQTARYMKIGNYVYLSGLVTRTSGTNNVMFTLPSGYTNTNGSSHTAAAGSSALLGSDGGVNIAADINCRGTGTTGYISLAGIRFFVGANDNRWRKFRGGIDGKFSIAGAYGGSWPVPAIRRDGKIVFLEGLGNFGSAGNAMKIPLGFTPGQTALMPVLNGTNKRIDIKPSDIDSYINVAGTGTVGFTNSWVVDETNEGDIRWNS